MLIMLLLLFYFELNFHIILYDFLFQSHGDIFTITCFQHAIAGDYRYPMYVQYISRIIYYNTSYIYYTITL